MSSASTPLGAAGQSLHLSFGSSATSKLGVVQDGELRAADELSLWGVVNKTESLAEMDAPVQETEGAARKRKIAKMAYNRALGRLETHEHALKKAAQAKQDGVEDDSSKARDVQINQVCKARVFLTDKIANAVLHRPDAQTVASVIRAAKRNRHA